MAAEIETLRKANLSIESARFNQGDEFETIQVTRGTAKSNLVSSIGH